MSMAEIMAGPHAIYRNKVQSMTWGHLFPKDGCYEGVSVFGVDIYGTLFILSEDYDIPSSPWFYEVAQEYYERKMYSLEEGCIYEARLRFTVVHNKAEGTSRLRSRELSFKKRSS